ncbi:hypothetical protein J6P92_06040 [bacterium]|nr:hypothetical protein [bacterium]
MFKTLKEAVKITNSNIILTIPLIVFVKFIDLYSLYTKHAVDFLPKFIIVLVTVLFVSGIFCSVWFNMIKGAVNNSKKIYVLDNDRTGASLSLFKTMREGINNLFLPFVGVYLIFGLIQIVFTQIVYWVGVNLIGVLSSEELLSIQEIALTSISEDNSMAVFLDKLSAEQILFFAEWSLLFILLTCLVLYLIMLWIPEVVYNTQNPVKALFKSIVKLFGNFLETFRMFLFLWFVGFVLLFLNTFSMINPFIYLFMNVILFYFFLFVAICVFLYYNKRFCNDEE